MPVSISVVTPSYNQARYLEETLRSVVSQRDAIHEYFVIDGGSTDGSVDIIKKYASHIDYWISENDAGQCDAIQKGFARATGDVLYWLNSDDVSLPDAVFSVQKAFERNPQWDAVTGYHLRIDDQSRIISAHRIPGESPAYARWGIHHVAQQTCFFRRSSYMNAGGINPALRLALDTDLWCKMFNARVQWGHLGQYLAAYRIHDRAKTSVAVEELERELAQMRIDYPDQCAASVRHSVGKSFYALSQILTGRQYKSLRDGWRWRGKTLAEVFGQNA